MARCEHNRTISVSDVRCCVDCEQLLTGRGQRLNIFEFLEPAFLDAMNEIGRYGHKKYGADSFHTRALRGDTSRGSLRRTAPHQIAAHAQDDP